MTTEPKTELEAAEMISRGELPSPYFYFGSELFACRITGTKCAWREKHAEFVWRDPGIWLSEEMQRRCTGLPVVIGHPPSGILNTKEFAERVIGLIILTWVRESEAELWGVMRVLDHDAAAALVDTQYDSSPAVLFSKDSNNVTITLHDGEKLLCESFPALVDHLAIVPKGVWTRKGDVPGVEVTQTKELADA
jgi:colicin import membrane protein